MIVFLVTRGSAFTLKKLRATATDFRVVLMRYDEIFKAKALPRGTYVFTGVDRLAMWELRVAAAIYRHLKAHGARVLNDPARVLSRHGLLRRLRLAGINNFDAYRVEDCVQPRRWPVFLRAEGVHDGPFNPLLHDQQQLKTAIDQAVERGIPMSVLLITEYLAKPVQLGLFRRLAVYRIGDRSVADTCVHGVQWRARIDKDGIAPKELYEDELRIVRLNPHRAVIGKAFEIAGVDYGRADFGLVDGVPQIYEINTSPHLELLGDSPSPFRSESRRMCNANLMAALASIDTADDGSTIPPLKKRSRAAGDEEPDGQPAAKLA
jgi:hypothetical protein